MTHKIDAERNRPAREERVAAALHAVRLSNVRPADRVAVVGGGRLAEATLEVLLARGVGKVALAGAGELADAAARAGVQVFAPPASPDALVEVRGKLGGYGPDIVFACEADSEGRRLAIELVRPAGTVVLVGDDGCPTWMNPNLLVFADKRVLGSRGFNEMDLRTAQVLIGARRLRTVI